MKRLEPNTIKYLKILHLIFVAMWVGGILSMLTLIINNRLKNAGIPIDTVPHPAGAREPREEGWRRVVFIGPDGELIEFRG